MFYKFFYYIFNKFPFYKKIFWMDVGIFKRIIESFSVVEGSKVHNSFIDGYLRYLVLVLKKLINSSKRQKLKYIINLFTPLFKTELSTFN